jgi:hypothetical protein
MISRSYPRGKYIAVKNSNTNSVTINRLFELTKDDKLERGIDSIPMDTFDNGIPKI